TLSVLGKFDGKSDEGFLVGYSLNSKAYRVYNLVTKRVEVNLHVNFLEDKPNVKGVPQRKLHEVLHTTLKSRCFWKKKDEDVELIVVPSAVMIPREIDDSRTSSTKSKKEKILTDPHQEEKVSSTDTLEDNPKIQAFRKDLPTEIEVSPTPTLRIHNIHQKSQILVNSKSAVQTRSKVQTKSGAHALLSHIKKQQRNNHKDQQHCLFACFLSQEEPKKIVEALQDDSWVQAMQEELLQFKLQQVWVLVDLPHGMKVIGTKWVYRNKRDERGVVVRNKARLVAQGYTQLIKDRSSIVE
ncbi:putative ribonuclease H-like domain-containing protein, partial [Tanacetum coccineum]